MTDQEVINKNTRGLIQELANQLIKLEEKLKELESYKRGSSPS